MPNGTVAQRDHLPVALGNLAMEDTHALSSQLFVWLVKAPNPIKHAMHCITSDACPKSYYTMERSETTNIQHMEPTPSNHSHQQSVW